MGVSIVGVGIHPFGRTDLSAQQMGVIAIRRALADAGASWTDIEFAVGGSLDGGQSDVMVSVLGQTGIQFINVLNGCATGTSALITASNMIETGQGKVGVVIGMDKHDAGAFTADPTDWGKGAWYGETGMFVNPQFFALKLQRYMHEHDISESTLAETAVKAYRNGSLNPNAWRQKPLTVADVMESRMINDPLRQYMICSPSAGAVALVIAETSTADRWAQKPVHVAGAALRTRLPGSFEIFTTSMPTDLPKTPSELSSAAVFEKTGLTPSDIDVWQVQDTEVGAELMHMAEIGLCAHGEQTELIRSGATQIEGASPVNTDGGLLANGEPVGASGLRMIHENTLQLRGEAADRQVTDPKVAFSHVYGAPGISACTILTV
jgi:acetyl-CoA acetyltransferase